MTVTDSSRDSATPRAGTLALAVFIAAALVPAVVAVVLTVVLNGVAGDSPSKAAEDAYIRQVAERVDVIERDRQAFIDAGTEMCRIAGGDAAGGSREVLVDHGLGGYATQWTVVSAAAAAHLC
jgi:hypothetical protein